MSASVENLASFIDHTFLKPDGSKDAIAKLCREAKKFSFASVCVNPSEVATAKRLLKGSTVKVCTVIGFPLGQSSTMIKGLEITDAYANGADEVDVVLNQRLLKYDPDACAAELEHLASYRYSFDEDGAKTRKTVKLIIECCNLTDEEKVLACKMAKKAGFDFVKTSTGFGKGGATVEDVKLMRKAVGKKMGVKASGGIRDRATAEAMIKAGATRIGTSNGVEICSL